MGRLETRERTTRDQVVGENNTRTFGIGHSDQFRSHFASGLLLFNYFLCRYLVFCTIGLLIKMNKGVIDKVQQRSMQSQFHYTIGEVY